MQAKSPVLPGHVLGNAHAPNTLEMWLDYVCPFSAKAFLGYVKNVHPAIEAKYPGKVKFIFRQQVQPWHPQSTMTHEVGMAVEAVTPGKFFDFSKLLFERQVEFFDLKIQNMTREQIYEKLLHLVKDIGVDSDKVGALLKLKDGGGTSFNTGNSVTDDLKRVIRLGRQNGIHVSPTATWNGIVENGVSSSWGPEEFLAFLKERLP